MDELPVIQPGHAVEVEAVQADHVAGVAREHQDRAPAEARTDIPCGTCWEEGPHALSRPASQLTHYSPHALTCIPINPSL